MKRLFLTLAFVFVSFVSYAQSDVTQFLGIPIDGSKSAMIEKLCQKGFEKKYYSDGSIYLTGEFNGYDVIITVVTTNNKVSRIVVRDAYDVEEATIKIRFNTLCSQFVKNPKYVAFEDFTISQTEDISYEMTVHDKRYEAVFYQKSNLEESELQAAFQKQLLDNFTEEQLSKFTEKDMIDAAAKYVLEHIHMSKKCVWFYIEEFYGKYSIVMYYDNEYNRAQGSDL